MLVLSGGGKMRKKKEWSFEGVVLLLMALVATSRCEDVTNRPLMDFDMVKDALSLVLPHDTYPGYTIKQLEPSNVTSLHQATHGQPIHNFRLLDTSFSKFFTVLENGVVMTTGDLTPLVNQPVHLTILEETPNSTATHHLQLFVMDRKDMLRFPGATLDTLGEVMENQPAGTPIRGIPHLQANSVSGSRSISYRIISGNEDEAFALKDLTTQKVDNVISIGEGEQTDGVILVTKKPLDREEKKDYTLTIEAADTEGINKAIAKITITVLDINDNRPVFTKPEYKFSMAGIKSTDLHGNSTVSWPRFSQLGHVEAKDEDGDKVAYKLITPSNYVIIVPQTGELLLANEPEMHELLVEVEAHDLRTPSLSSAKPARVLIEFVAPEPIPMIVQHLNHDAINQHSHRRDKRRVTRAVRPTKRIEFTETDGDLEGKVVFQLEKETDRETFKIRDENIWVQVETNGAVRVKKKWDYEELGPEKTIDFWVIITNSGHNGESINPHYLIHFLWLCDIVSAICQRWARWGGGDC
ncbi:Cadherin-like [Sergentomyia squamirostris]